METNTPTKIPTVVVVDDHPSVADGFRRAWRGFAQVVGTALTAPSGLAMAMDLKPDVVTMDINLPGSPWDAIRTITATTDSRVLVVTGGRTEKIVDAAMDSGASGVAEKGLTNGEILSALRIVANGKQFWGATWERRRKAIEQGEKITPGMTEVDLNLISDLANGKSIKQIADEYEESEAYTRDIYESLRKQYGVATNEQLVAMAAVEQFAQL